MSWSRRWRALLDEDAPDLALRVARGRAYARSGRVTELRALAGRLEARVQGGRATPYQVELGLPVLPDDDWATVVAAVAAQVRHAARLLANQVPDGLAGELEERGLRLFPHRAEVTTACGCDDPSPWCKHVVAVVEVSGAEMDADPFLLLRLRGRGRERLLTDLGRARRAQAPDSDSQPLAGLPSGDGWATAGAPLPDAQARAGADGATPLAQRGDPPGWAGGVSAADLFAPLVDRGAAWAARVARGGDREPAA